MPANQFFTDWVTGEIITAAKLNQMKNNVQPYLGYTPLNKAGDTMTGPLSVPGVAATGTAGEWTSAGWAKAYQLFKGATLFWPKGSSSRAIGLGVANGEDVLRFVSSAADDTGQPPSYPFQFNMVSGDLSVGGVITGRYDHANRFVVSGNVGGSGTISIPAANDLTVMSFGVFVPSGKSLIIRRIRYKFIASPLRLRVVGTTTYTYNMPGGIADDTVNIGIISGNNNTNSVQIKLYNSDFQNPAGANPQDGFWIEFDIA